MKIEKLNEDKIKITLSVDDLAERNIDFHSFIYNSPESQDMFWDMIQEAEKEYGFNIDESMIYVEASSSNSGNFTLIVTKSESKIPPISSLKTKIKKGNYKLKRKNAKLDIQNNIYSFEDFEDICSFCKLVNVKDFKKNSLYKMNDVYYLQTFNMPYSSILEYANLVKSPDIFLAKLAEYGSLLIKDNAMQTIKKHFLKDTRKRAL